MELHRRRKLLAFALLTVFISCGGAFVCAELLLRITGHQPWRYIIFLNTPRTHVQDATLGWRNRPGLYTCAPPAPGWPPVTITFLPDGTRCTAPPPGAERAREELWCVGGSFTRGDRVSDEETFPWRLQSMRPETKVVNWGVDGYGTHQALLLLKQALPRRRPPAVVLYGFIESHEERNVAAAEWMRLLTVYAAKGHVQVPYCTLDAAGRLVPHAPERYPLWPTCKCYATVNFLQHQYAKARTAARSRQRRAVTEKLIRDMDALTTQYGAELVLVLLQCSPEAKADYMRFAGHSGIRTIDCAFPMTTEMRVPGDLHPNGEMHRLWAACINRELARVLH